MIFFVRVGVAGSSPLVGLAFLSLVVWYPACYPRLLLLVLRGLVYQQVRFPVHHRWWLFLSRLAVFMVLHLFCCLSRFGAFHGWLISLPVSRAGYCTSLTMLDKSRASSLFAGLVAGFPHTATRRTLRAFLVRAFLPPCDSMPSVRWPASSFLFTANAWGGESSQVHKFGQPTSS